MNIVSLVDNSLNLFILLTKDVLLGVGLYELFNSSNGFSDCDLE